MSKGLRLHIIGMKVSGLHRVKILRYVQGEMLGVCEIVC
jgi:hypothetical protein